MLGIDDPQVWLAYVLCVGSALLCVVYGVLNWKETDEEQTLTTSSSRAVVQE